MCQWSFRCLIVTGVWQSWTHTFSGYRVETWTKTHDIYDHKTIRLHKWHISTTYFNNYCNYIIIIIILINHIIIIIIIININININHIIIDHGYISWLDFSLFGRRRPWDAPAAAPGPGACASGASGARAAQPGGDGWTHEGRAGRAVNSFIPNIYVIYSSKNEWKMLLD